jgi:hypothetical protein
MKIEIVEGRHGYYNMIWGTLDGLKSRVINEIFPSEQDLIIGSIVGFILGIEQFKKLCK